MLCQNVCHEEFNKSNLVFKILVSFSEKYVKAREEGKARAANKQK